MKRTKLLVMTAIAVFGIGTVVHAELPANSIIIGNQAYTVGYLQNNSDLVNEKVMNNLDNLYYVDSTGAAKDIFSGATISESQLVSKIGTTLTSYSDSGVATKYTSDTNNQFIKPTNNNTYQSYVVVDATYSTITSGIRVVYANLRNIVGAKDATYYTIGSTTTDNLVSTSSQATYFSSGTGDVKTITIYDSNKVAIYVGNLVVSFDSTKTSGSDTQTIALSAYANSDQTSVTQSGNLNGNITNTGLASIDYNQKWIYYINTGDKNKLYKRNVDGLDDYPISDDSVGYINVVGNWVYYVNYSDNEKIYKVKVDGTGRQKVSDNMASGLFVYGDNIFYINHSDSGKVYVLNSSGSMKITSDTASNINVIGNSSGATIYYSNASLGGKLYKAIYSTASTSVSVQKLTDVAANYINAINQSIVYYTSSDGKLYRLSGTTSSPVKILTNVTGKGKTGTTMTSTEEKLSVISLDSQGTIYYRSNVDGGKLYKADSDYNGYKLVDSVVDYINVIDSSGATPANTNSGYIYYLKSGKLSRIPISTDGTAAAEAIAKPKSSLKIKSIETIPTISTENIKTFNFPEKVSAVMSDGTVQELVVNWDKANGKFSKGIYTYSGTVLGYGNKVTLNVSITTAMPTISNVVVKNDAGNKDTVTVSNLKQGDIVSVYTLSDQIKPTKTAIATSSGVAAITGLALNSDGGTVYVTVTTSGKAESAKLGVSYSAEAPVGFAVDAENSQVTGLKQNQSYTIYMYDATKTNDATIDWDGTDSTGKTDPVTLSVISDGNGTVDLTKQTSSNTFESIVTSATNGGKDMLFRIKQKGTTSSGDSLLSTAMTVSKAKVPDYVTIDYISGVINGTDNTMQYTYSNPDTTVNPSFSKSEWKDCTSGMTAVSINMYLEVWVRVKPTGPTLSSKPKGLSLFAPPTVTGIVEGKMYSGDNRPTPTWTAANGTITGKIRVYNANEQDDSLWDKVGTASDFENISSGAKIDVTNAAFSTDKTYAFILTQTKTANGKTGTAKVIIKFTVNSTKPAELDISMKETKGVSSPNTLPVYYSATPEWTSFAGTYDKVSLYRLDQRDPAKTGDSAASEFATAATIDFTKGNTVPQAGYYMLEVITTNSQNGATTTTDKFFVIDRSDVTPASLVIADGSTFMNGATYSNIAIKPTVTSGITYYSLTGLSGLSGSWSATFPTSVSSDGIYIAEDTLGKNARFVSAKIMGDSGSYIAYTFGHNISVNSSLYSLSVKTTSCSNGAYQTKQYEFGVNNGATVQPAPHVILTLDANGKYVLSDVTSGEDMTLMQYSVDGGTAWNSISSSSSYTITDIIAKSISATNGVRVKVKAYGSYPESQQQLITVQKQATPQGIKFAFTTTPGTPDSITSKFTVGTVPTDITQCEYSSDGGSTWTSIPTGGSVATADVSTLLNNVVTKAMDITVRQKGSGTSTSSISIASDPISMGVWKPNIPSSITVSTASDGTCSLVSNDVNVALADLEYSYDKGSNWYSGDTTFNSSALTAANDIWVRYQANGVKAPSSNMTITVPDAPSVTFATPDKLTKVKLSATGVTDLTTMEYQINAGTWTTCLSDGEIVATAGQTINVRLKATSTNPPSEIKELTVAASNIGAAATPAVKTADADLGSSVAFGSATKITIAGTDVILTNVKGLGASYDAATNISTVVTKLQADIDAVGALSGKYTVANSGTKLTITSVATGSSATVDLTGSDTASGATLLGFTTLTAVKGTDGASS